eukprot:TRINITY_DN2958_c0_g1_i1.p1 TRINITY_DN2958_c0_g1~~TRINITY_DN2958_c0_g1_i1.p1  ORF type:complete len:420 (+),score=81.40 TRINITY_DN2958_c0_g1_i1:46-1305(+)
MQPPVYENRYTPLTPLGQQQHHHSQPVQVKYEQQAVEEEAEAIPMSRPSQGQSQGQKQLKPVESILESTTNLLNQAGTFSAPRGQDTDNLRAVINAKQIHMEMIKEKGQLSEQLARTDMSQPQPFSASQLSSYSDTLQPQKAKKPSATETNTSFGMTKPAKVPGRQQRKRKEITCDIPDIDLSDIGSFNVVPASQKFRSWLTKCLQNGSRSFTKGDASQLASYATKHSGQYFALKDGWVRTLKGLEDGSEKLKAWYAYDCLLNMKEFSGESVRATWVVKLPDLVAEYMDFTHEGGWQEKYTKLVQTWRGRIDGETMQAIIRKLSAIGISLKDTAVTSTSKLPYSQGSTVDFFSEKISEWVSATVGAINLKAKTVAIKPSTAGLPSSTISFAQAVSLLRKPKRRGQETKRRRTGEESPNF